MTGNITRIFLSAMLIAMSQYSPAYAQGSDVEVSVTEQVESDFVQYHYVVTNMGTKQITTLVIGQGNGGAGDPELLPAPLGWSVLNGVPSGSVEVPEGWVVEVEPVEEKDNVLLRWTASLGKVFRIMPGQTLRGFVVRTGSASGLYRNSDWTVIFSDASTESGLLVPGTDPGPAASGTSVRISQDTSRVMTPGERSTWTATTEGGGPSHWYQYWLNCYDVDEWRLVADYSPQNTFSWTPGMPGGCDLMVRVKNSESATSYDAAITTGDLVIKAGSPLRVVRYSASVAFPVPAGTSITWTATVTGDADPAQLQYQFWMRDPVVGWHLLRDYGVGNNVYWTPLTPGTYYTQVRVRRAGSLKPYEARSNSEDVTITDSPVSMIALKTDKEPPVAPGSNLTWTAEASGGSTPLEYRFELFDSAAGQWTVERDYESSSSWTWTPAKSGIYAIRARVRAETSGAEFESEQISEPFIVTTGPVVNTSMTMNQIFPVAAPVPIVFTAHASGGFASLEYKFYLYDATTLTWALVQDWSPDNQWSWNASNADYGRWAVQAWIRSAGSSAQYEAYTGTGYFVLLR